MYLNVENLEARYNQNGVPRVETGEFKVSHTTYKIFIFNYIFFTLVYETRHSIQLAISQCCVNKEHTAGCDCYIPMTKSRHRCV